MRPPLILVAAAVLLFCPLLVFSQADGAKQNESLDSQEVHFTPDQLKSYYAVYQNADVRYLRSVFNAYLSGSVRSPEEKDALSKWSKDYYRSKFVVLSRDANPFGGTLITILFQKKPDKIFVAWVYAEGQKGELTLRELDPSRYRDEDVKRTLVRYKSLTEDSKHAM